MNLSYLIPQRLQRRRGSPDGQRRGGTLTALEAMLDSGGPFEHERLDESMKDDWARPVVHWEIEALDLDRLRTLYSRLFNWRSATARS